MIYVYLVIAASALFGGWMWGESREQFGRDAIQMKWDADKLVRSTKALDTIKEYRQHEQDLIAKVQGAQRELESERQRRAAVAAGVRGRTDSVRNAIVESSGGGLATSDTLAACRARSTAQGLGLAAALRTSELCAGDAEAASDSVRKLLVSWPTNPVTPAKESEK